MASSPQSESVADGGTAVVADEAITLAPRFWVPLGLTLLAALVLAGTTRWNGAPWLGLAMLAFASFLLVQTTVLRLSFRDEALLVSRGEQEIRRFPTREWLGWRLFWPGLPVLFYFRERRSPHLLPVLFDATVLRAQLEQRVPRPVSPKP